MTYQACPAVKMERLLLPTDGSEFSEGAIREGINLAKGCSSKLYAMSVVEMNPEYAALAPQLVEKDEKDTRRHLESVKERASKEGVDCETIVRLGDEPHRYIVEEAAKRDVEMIIIGRRGRTGLKRLMMGSVTAKVIGYAPCKVLVVPRAARLVLKKILIATDGSKYSNAAGSYAVGMAKRCGANLIVVSVVPSESIPPLDIVHSQMQRELIAEKELKEAEKNVKSVKELAEKEGVKVRGFVLTGRPYEAIIDTAKENSADIIVMGSYGRTDIERLLMGIVAERVIGFTECAVLVVKA